MSIIDVKPSIKSKTMMANAILCILIWVLRLFGIEVPGEVAGSIFAVINMGLRLISTGKVVLT